MVIQSIWLYNQIKKEREDRHVTLFDYFVPCLIGRESRYSEELNPKQVQVSNKSICKVKKKTKKERKV